MDESKYMTAGKFMVLSVERLANDNSHMYIDVRGNGRTYDTLEAAESVVGTMSANLAPVIVVVVKGNV